MSRSSPRPRPRPAPTGHRCDPITQAERAHYDVPPGARWRCSYRRYVRGSWTTVQLWLDDRRAADFCSRNEIVYPGARSHDPVLVAPPMTSAHDPDHGAPRRPATTTIDARARAAGEREE